jgi:hypothetical protein
MGLNAVRPDFTGLFVRVLTGYGTVLSPEKLGVETVREYLVHLMNDNEVVAQTPLSQCRATHNLLFP